LQAGAAIGLFLALYYNFFYNSMKATDAIDWKTIGLDIMITITITALSGATIAIVVDKMK
jgi:hypothetical protein